MVRFSDENCWEGETVIARSGQSSSHIRQFVQPVGSTINGLKPFAPISAACTNIPSIGQTSIQRQQPLHQSWRSSIIQVCSIDADLLVVELPIDRSFKAVWSFYLYRASLDAVIPAQESVRE